MAWVEVISASAAVISITGAWGVWLWSRIDRKFDKIDAKFESILTEIKELRKDVQAVDSRVSIIEGYLLGRDARPNGTTGKSN